MTGYFKRITAAVSAGIILSLGLAACTSSAESEASFGWDAQMSSASVGAAAAYDDFLLESEFIEEGISPNEPQTAVIKNGEVTIKVADPAEAAEKIAAETRGLGGFISEKNVYKNAQGDATSAYLQVRVPEKSFDEAFTRFAEIGSLQNEHRTELDVTLERSDLTARKGALETSVERLETLMAKADSVQDLVEIEAQLSKRQQELDGLSAQLDVLEGSIAMSTIWVNLSTDSPIAGGPGNFIEGIKAGFDSLLKMFATLGVAAGVVLPWLVFLGVLTWAVVAAITRVRRRANKS